MDNNEKKAQFHDALAFLIESAGINSGTLTVDEIKSAFEDIIEDESMYTFIYSYLIENRIKIIGISDDYDMKTQVTTAKNTEDHNFSPIDKESEKEKHIANMYMNDISSVINYTDTEELNLLESYLADHMNRSIINSLTENNLKIVPPIAMSFKGKGVSFADLLQEGNLGLIEGIMTYNGPADTDIFHSHLETIITNTINDAVTKQDTSSRISIHAADRANELDRASVKLSKELDRTPTLTELAAYLSLPEDEVERVMKMSLNALTINEDIDEDIDKNIS